MHRPGCAESSLARVTPALRQGWTQSRSVPLLPLTLCWIVNCGELPGSLFVPILSLHQNMKGPSMAILHRLGGEGIGQVTRGSSHSLTHCPGTDQAEQPQRAPKSPGAQDSGEVGQAAPSGVWPSGHPRAMQGELGLLPTIWGAHVSAEGCWAVSLSPSLPTTHCLLLCLRPKERRAKSVVLTTKVL